MEVEDHPLDHGDFERTIPKKGSTAAERSCCGTPEDASGAEATLRKGELKFILAGDELQGGWVLVRMKRDGSACNNWLLIKHRDTWAREGDGDVILKRTGRYLGSMKQIAAGKGRRPSPFMLARRKTSAKPIWHADKNAGVASSSPAHARRPGT